LLASVSGGTVPSGGNADYADMGHVRLGVLPKSRKWRQVVEELRLGAEIDVVAASAADAAEASLHAASKDPAFLHAFWLLTQLPLAARGPDFTQDLGRLGVQVPDQPSLIDVVAGISAAVDRYAREQGGRSDLGEMAQMAAVESFMALIGPNLPSLFAPSPGEVQRAIGRFAGGERFSTLAREFFTRLTQRSLDYYLSRELNNHIGAAERFPNDGARSQFDDALGRHCREASRIIEAFAGGWYGKNVYQGDGLTPDSIRRFAPIAFKKIRAELRKRRDAEE
jgi:hypothetical protein